MIKYVPSLTDVVLEEIPHRVSLAVEISNCRGNCIGCHSPFLKKDLGDELTAEAVEKLLKTNFGVNCFLFLRKGNNPKTLKTIAYYLRSSHPELELALYSGRESVEDELFEIFDFVKVGPYIKEFGPLNEKTTNQRLYYHRADITSSFWRKK